MNRAILMGNLGADPELRYTQSGDAIMRLRLATSKTWKTPSGEKKEATQWHTVTLWGKRAEALNKHLSKGTRLLVEGEIQYSQYEDKDGNKRTSTEIRASNIEFAGGKRDGGSSGYGGGDKYATSGADDSEIPF